MAVPVAHDTYEEETLTIQEQPQNNLILDRTQEFLHCSAPCSAEVLASLGLQSAE